MIRHIPFAFMAKRNSQLVGRDGDLVVLNGQTIDIPGGSVKEYSSVTIDAGGTLRITGNGGGWTEIDCLGNFVCNGTILCRAGYSGQTTHAGGTFTKTSEIGLGNLSYTIVQANGGAGGKGAQHNTSGYAGGSQIAGSGGGGSGGGVWDGGTVRWGGAGGNGTSNGSASVNGGGVSGGVGNSTLSHGSAGMNIGAVGSGGGRGGSGGGGGGGGGGVYWTSPSLPGGGGGGGGYKGPHGKGLAIKVSGIISGSGVVDCGGGQGFNGAKGGDSNFITSPYYGVGGGGGGGAGGSGGRIIIRYKSGTLPQLKVGGGNGGSGGAVGVGTTLNASAGTSGAKGSDGSLDVQLL